MPRTEETYGAKVAPKKQGRPAGSKNKSTTAEGYLHSNYPSFLSALCISGRLKAS